MAPGTYLTHAGEYLITLLFTLYMLAVILRFLLQYVRADFYNPISQLLVKVTNPLLRPLRRWIPGYAGIDWPSVLLLITLQTIELCLVALLKTHGLPMFPGLIILVFAHLLKLTVYLFLIVIIIQAISSWINPGAYSPITVLMYQLTTPLIRPIQKFIPPAGGMDWSPFVALIILQLILILFIAPLQDYGNLMAGYPLRLL